MNQAGRWERQSASSFARGLRGCASGCCRSCTMVVVLPSTWCVCPHTSSTDSCGEGVWRPRRLHPSARTRCCTAVVAAVALEAGSALRGDSCRRPQWNLLAFQAGSRVTVRPVKYGVSSLMDFVSERLHCHLVLCACWHDGSEAVVSITLRATASGSCPASTASNAVHSDSQLPWCDSQLP